MKNNTLLIIDIETGPAIDALEEVISNYRRDGDWRREIGALTLFKEGNQWCAVRPDFTNLAESPAWFGKTPTAAVEKFLKDKETK